MKHALFAAAAFAALAVVPASAQTAPPPPGSAPMMGDPMMGGGRSCVSGGQFVPCPPGGGMQPGMMNQGAGMGGGMSGGMAAQDPNMNRPMTAAERRRAARQQRM